MKKNTVLLLLVILTLLILLVAFLYSREFKKNNQRQKSISKVSLNYENLKNKYFIEYIDNHYQFDSRLKICTTNNDTLILEDILMDDPRLIFYFSKFSCPSCVENEIARLKKNESNYDEDHVIIMTNYDKIRDVVMFCKLNNINYPIYLICDEIPNFNIQKKNYPFYYVLKNDFQVRDIFLVNIDSPELTDKYLDIIWGKYFDLHAIE